MRNVQNSLFYKYEVTVTSYFIFKQKTQSVLFKTHQNFITTQSLTLNLGQRRENSNGKCTSSHLFHHDFSSAKLFGNIFTLLVEIFREYKVQCINGLSREQWFFITCCSQLFPGISSEFYNENCYDSEDVPFPVSTLILYCWRTC